MSSARLASFESTTCLRKRKIEHHRQRTLWASVAESQRVLPPCRAPPCQKAPSDRKNNKTATSAEQASALSRLQTNDAAGWPRDNPREHRCRVAYIRVPVRADHRRLDQELKPAPLAAPPEVDAYRTEPSRDLFDSPEMRNDPINRMCRERERVPKAGTKRRDERAAGYPVRFCSHLGEDGKERRAPRAK